MRAPRYDGTPRGIDRDPATFSDVGRCGDEREAAKPASLRAAAANDQALLQKRLVTLARFDHANYLGTPETYANAARTRQGPLARLYMAGGLTIDQLAWSVEIAMVAEQIERDVDPGIVSYEPRIDDSRYGKIKASLVEGIMRVRREVAYTHWRGWLPQPKRAVLDMIVGDPKPFSMVAREYGIGHRVAKRRLIEALDRWPDALTKAEDEVDDATLVAAYAGIL
jgi:hypothetical protein